MRIATRWSYRRGNAKFHVLDDDFLSMMTVIMLPNELGLRTVLSMQIAQRISGLGVRPEVHRLVSGELVFLLTDHPELYRAFVGPEPLEVDQIPRFCREYWGGARPIGGLPDDLAEAGDTG
jgi:hypothetical protein